MAGRNRRTQECRTLRAIAARHPPAHTANDPPCVVNTPLVRHPFQLEDSHRDNGLVIGQRRGAAERVDVFKDTSTISCGVASTFSDDFFDASRPVGFQSGLASSTSPAHRPTDLPLRPNTAASDRPVVPPHLHLFIVLIFEQSDRHARDLQCPEFRRSRRTAAAEEFRRRHREGALVRIPKQEAKASHTAHPLYVRAELHSAVFISSRGRAPPRSKDAQQTRNQSAVKRRCRAFAADVAERDQRVIFGVFEEVVRSPVISRAGRLRTAISRPAISETVRGSRTDCSL